MDDQDRERYERDLAVAILGMWLLYESIQSVRTISFGEFTSLFNEHVRPILSRVYGMARNTLANTFGVNYPSRPDGNGGQVISLPNLQAAMDRFVRTLWDSFNKRWSSRPSTSPPVPPTSRPPSQPPTTSPAGRSQPGTAPPGAPPPVSPNARQTAPVIEEEEEEEPRPLFTESDAEMTAITSVTNANSQGQMDAARDVESRAGTRLVAIWRAEPDACDDCAFFDGKGRAVWGRECPDGPTRHPRCRCRLEWRPLV